MSMDGGTSFVRLLEDSVSARAVRPCTAVADAQPRENSIPRSAARKWGTAECTKGPRWRKSASSRK
eukprot:scaffold113004_cov32-Tisochrysis_lutea.AAC.10